MSMAAMDIMAATKQSYKELSEASRKLEANITHLSLAMNQHNAQLRNDRERREKGGWAKKVMDEQEKKTDLLSKKLETQVYNLKHFDNQ